MIVSPRAENSNNDLVRRIANGARLIQKEKERIWRSLGGRVRRAAQYVEDHPEEFAYRNERVY